MISAFGVDHGYIEKAFKNLAPKLLRAEGLINRANPVAREQTLASRFQENYAQWRGKAGGLQHEINPHKWEKNDAELMAHGFGPPSPRVVEARARTRARALEQARGHKEGARAMVTGIGNISRRKGRKLP